MKKLSLEARLRRAAVQIAPYALRDPRTKQEIFNRRKWERLNNIIWKRYDDKLYHPTNPKQRYGE